MKLTGSYSCGLLKKGGKEMDRANMLKELKELYRGLEDLQQKRASNQQRIRISERIKEILQSLLQDINEFQ